MIFLQAEMAAGMAMPGIWITIFTIGSVVFSAIAYNFIEKKRGGGFVTFILAVLLGVASAGVFAVIVIMLLAAFLYPDFDA